MMRGVTSAAVEVKDGGIFVMNRRYIVYHAGKAVAVVHAPSADEAVRSACAKISKDCNPEHCSAILFEIKPKQR